MQKGFAHLILLILLVVGMAIGVYLVSQSQIFRSRASEADLEQKTIDQLTADMVDTNRGGRQASDTSSVDDKLAHLRVVASVRKKKLIEEATANPQKFLEDANLAEKRDSFPEDIRADLEQRRDLQGSLVLLHSDDFDNKTSHNEYDLVQDRQTYRVNFTGDTPKFTPGQQVKMSGLTIGSAAVVDSGDSLAFQVTRGAQSIKLSSTGEQKTLVLLVNFNNDQSQPINQTQAQDFFFSDTPTGLNRFYSENSFGQNIETLSISS
jgi:hypothetical protein